MDIKCEVNPKHKNNGHVENGLKVLYLQLLKYLYGCMESSLLRYDLYSKTLKSHGLVVNPYDRYIANSTINGKQFTISWYVDNNKVSHIYEELNKIIIKKIAEIFGELTVSRVNNHKSLGMEIEFLANVKNHFCEGLHQGINIFFW